MKTKNILKIGVFSIVILSLLISPILNLHHQKASADVGIVGSLGYQSWKEILARVPETQAEKWCDAIYGEEEWKGVPFVTKNWWSHLFCVIQLSVIEGIGAAMFGLTQSLIGYILWALNPVTYGGFVKNIAVQGIWSVLRNFMNLALVLILVFIAIATILGIKKYRWQETLWKLVIVALLINFSLIIPGIILDTSHFITYTFLNLARIDDLDIADSMMKGLASEELARAGKYQLPMIDNIIATYDSSTKETSVEATGWGLGIGKSLIVAILLLLIGIFVVIALVAIFFTMIFRAFMIIALLCVAPIAFAAWILPDTEKYWKMWWQQFIKWCTYPILFALMLYIGIYIMTGIKLGTAGLAKEDIKIGLITTVVQMILFSMFLVGGLIFSIQGGGAVAQFVMKQGSKVRAFVGYKALKGVTGSESYRKAHNFLEKSKFAPLHEIGVWMSRQPEKIRSAELKQIQEDYKKRNEDQIRHDMEMHKNDRARVATGLNELIERKKINYAKDSAFINIARNHPALNVPELKKAHPGLYTDYFTTPVEMQKAIKQAQLKAPRIIPLDVAKELAKIDLIAERVKGAGSEAIKSGNWNDILEELEKKGKLKNIGTGYTDYFFRSLWDANVPPESYAAMLGPMDVGKQRKWAQEFLEYAKRRIKGNTTAAIAELKKRRFDKNRFMNQLLPF